MPWALPNALENTVPGRCPHLGPHTDRTYHPWCSRVPGCSVFPLWRTPVRLAAHLAILIHSLYSHHQSLCFGPGTLCLMEEEERYYILLPPLTLPGEL